MLQSYTNLALLHVAALKKLLHLCLATRQQNRRLEVYSKYRKQSGCYYETDPIKLYFRQAI